MGKLLQRRTVNFIAIFLLLLGLVGAFAYFASQNTIRETEETRDTVKESAILKEYRLQDAFSDKLFAVGDLAYIYGERAVSAEVDKEQLIHLEEKTHFDYVRFIDRNGVNHSSDGRETSVIDRLYYLDGMNGNEGVCFIQNSRINGENLLGFYTPVYKEGAVIGVLLGLCNMDYVTELLTGVFQGYDAEAFLCASNGTVIASVFDEFGPNFLNRLYDRKHFSEAEEEHIREAFRTGEASSFTYTAELGDTTGYIQPVSVNNWFLVQIYPDEALYEDISEANKTGFEFMHIVLVIVIAYILYLVVRFLTDRRALERESRIHKNITIAMRTILNRFVEIDMENGTYRYLVNKSFQNEIPDSGDYRVFADYAVNHLLDEKEKRTLAEHMRLDSLKKCFTEDVQYVSYLTHSLWEEERYENFTFVCIDRNERGEAKTLVCMRMDVTEAQKLEQESMAALKEAYNSAEEANRAKSDFLSRMSHDIRTPLNAITGMTNIAKLHIEDEKRVKDCLTKIEASSGHLINLVNEVLDMSKIESGKLCLSEEPFDLYEVLENIGNIMQPQATAKDICMNIQSDALEHHLVIGDATRLEQLMINIMGNAVKFTPSGGKVDVMVREAVSIVKGYAKYEIICKDTGIGMDEESVKNVFDPFYRAKKSSNKIEGTGLGMSIAKNIANMMNGDITIESKLGEGTSFRVVVYLKKQSGAKKEQVEQQVCDYSGKRALLVEDNELNREIAETLLGITGISIETAKNGEEGYKMVESHPIHYYDIVFMDIQMPGWNGYQSASAIRMLEREDIPGLPIIAMSADAFVEDIKKAKHSGMNDHISKPIDMNRLLRVMEKYL